MRRRDAVIFLAATATLPLTRPASAVTVPDLGIFCDPTLRPVVTKICDLWFEKTGVPARVLCAPGGLMIAQLVRNARNDVVITRTDSMAAAAAQGQIKSETRANLWRGPLVLAVRAGTSSADPKTLKGPIAATDPTAAAVHTLGSSSNATHVTAIAAAARHNTAIYKLRRNTGPIPPSLLDCLQAYELQLLHHAAFCSGALAPEGLR